jgi:hypothetical protein
VLVSPTSGLTTTEVGGTDTFNVRLTSQPSANVVIDLNSNKPDQGTVSPSQLTFTPSNWDTDQLVTVTGADSNGLEDGDVPYLIRLQPATSADPNYAGRDADDVEVVNQSVNNPPTMQNPPANIVFSEDDQTTTVNLMGIGIGQSNEGQTPSVTIDDTAVAAFLDVVLTYTAPASEGVLAMTPKADQHGSGNILITVSDGIDSVQKTVTVTVSARNDSPVLTVDGQNTLALGGTLAIRGGAGNPTTELRVIATDVETAIGDLDCRIPLRPNLGALKLGADPQTGTTLQNGSTFKYQAILDGHLHYVHNGVLSGDDGFAIEIADGGQLDTTTSTTDPSRSEVAIITLTITGLTPPQVTINNASPATWTEGDTPVRIDAGATVQDLDFDINLRNFSGGQLTVSAATAKVGERIAIDGTVLTGITVSGTQLQTNPGNALVGTMSGGIDQTPLTITLTAACTPTLAQAILSGLTWTNISDHPGATADDVETRTLTITLRDGGGSTSVPVTRDITIDPVDDAPTITAQTVKLTPGLTITGQIVASDPEGSAVTISTTNDGGLVLPGAGNLTIQANGNFTYRHTETLTFQDSFGVKAWAAFGGTTLAVAIDAVETSVQLTSAGNLATGMRLRIGSEDMLVTGLSGNTATVTRGANGTTAATASLGSAVTFSRSSITTSTIQVYISNLDPQAPVFANLPRMRVVQGTTFSYIPTVTGATSAVYQLSPKPEGVEGVDWTFNTTTGTITWPTIQAPGFTTPGDTSDDTGYYLFGILVINGNLSSYMPITLKVTVGGNG